MKKTVITPVLCRLIAAAVLLPSLLLGEASKAPLASSLTPFIENKTLSGGVTLLADSNKILDHSAVGLSDIESGRSMKPDDLFWIASMTKPITAVAVMMMVEENKLQLDDPISKYLPEFQNLWLPKQKTDQEVTLVRPRSTPTIRQLLTHTSGISGGSALNQTSIHNPTLAIHVAGVGLAPMQSQPGEKWQYNNAGINTLGRLVEVASGKEFAAFLDERLFVPLGMKDTTFYPDESQVKRIATSYEPNDTKDGLKKTDVFFIRGGYSDRQRMPMPAGGLFSTAPDLVRFYQMILNEGQFEGKTYLKPESLREMTRPQLGEMKSGFTPGAGMGLGWQLVNAPQGVTETLSPGTFGHGGAYGTQAWIDPVKKRIHILLIQRRSLPNADASEMRAAFHQASAQIYP